MERFKKLFRMPYHVRNFRLSLDEVLSRTSREGIAFDIDPSTSALRVYKFSLPASIAYKVIEELEVNFVTSGNYEVHQVIKNMGDIEHGIEFDYMGLLKLLHRAGVFRKIHQNYFGGAYLLSQNSSRAKKIQPAVRDGSVVLCERIVAPAESHRIVMLMGYYRGGKNDPFLDLINSFYLAYVHQRNLVVSPS